MEFVLMKVTQPFFTVNLGTNPVRAAFSRQKFPIRLAG
jgi:hypothetical protein